MARKRSGKRAAQKAIVKSLRMTRRLVRRRGKTPGAMPGTVVHTGARKVDRVTFDVMQFDEQKCEETHPESLDACFPFTDGQRVSWLNVDGLHDVEQLRRLGELAALHPLVIEDLASTGQRPKLEDYEGELFIVLRMLRYNEETGQIDEEQLSIVLRKNALISVQEAPGDVFDTVRDRLRTAKGKIRLRAADYLAYALMDAVVDAYFIAVEKLSDRIEALEEAVLTDPQRDTIAEMHRVRAELLVLRRATWPLRDVFNSLIRDESDLISSETKVYLRDAYDHTIQVIDTVETLRDVVGGLMDLYLSQVSVRMNEVMKVLTIIATVFIPLTFLVGVYGMNFDYMPELDVRWAYPALWAVMLIVAIGMLIHFKRRNWL